MRKQQRVNARLDVKRKWHSGSQCWPRSLARPSQHRQPPVPTAVRQERTTGGITRNTIGSPVAALRNGPFGSFGVTGSAAKPPCGTGSLGIEVSDSSTSLAPSSEKVDFGNEVD